MMTFGRKVNCETSLSSRISGYRFSYSLFQVFFTVYQSGLFLRLVSGIQGGDAGCDDVPAFIISCWLLACPARCKSVEMMTSDSLPKVKIFNLWNFQNGLAICFPLHERITFAVNYLNNLVLRKCVTWRFKEWPSTGN